MKYNITENQYRYILKENNFDEESRNLSDKQKAAVFYIRQLF